jgi:hypothetical protein
MARKARPGLGTQVKFIALDDDAIGGDLSTVGARYAEYIRTANHKILEIDQDRNPSFYYLRPLDSQQVQRLQGCLMQARHLMVRQLDMLKAAEEGSKVERLTDQEKHDAKEVDNDYAEARKEVISECLIGCESHKVVSSLDDEGNPIYEEVRWPVGSPRPAGLLSSVNNDSLLVDNMVHYLVRVSSLTEKEKKR